MWSASHSHVCQKPAFKKMIDARETKRVKTPNRKLAVGSWGAISSGDYYLEILQCLKCLHQSFDFLWDCRRALRRSRQKNSWIRWLSCWGCIKMCYQIVLDEDNNGDVIVLEVFFTPPWFAEVDNKMHQLVLDSDITRINPGIFSFETKSKVQWLRRPVMDWSKKNLHHLGIYMYTCKVTVRAMNTNRNCCRICFRDPVVY